MATHAALILDWQRFSDAQRSALFTSGAPELLKVVTEVLEAGFFTRFELEATDVENVFYKLNMAPPADYRSRSMSVGDVIIDLKTNEAQLCAPFGWLPLPAATAASAPAGR